MKAVGSPAHNLLCPQNVTVAEGCAIVKKAGVCISQIGWGTVGANTSGVRGDGKMSSTSSMMRLYAVGSKFGGIVEPPSWWVGTAVELRKQKSVKDEYLEG